MLIVPVAVFVKVPLTIFSVDMYPAPLESMVIVPALLNPDADVSVAWLPVELPSINIEPFCTKPDVLIVELPSMVIAASLVNVPEPVQVEFCQRMAPSVSVEGPSTVSVLETAANKTPLSSSVKPAKALAGFVLSVTV